MAPLRLLILGGFDLFGGDGAPRQLPTRKAEALLAYLALPSGRSHRRDHLAALLWGDRADKQARHSLNQSVFSIRKVLAADGIDPIVVEGETLALKPEAIAVDAEEFQCWSEGTEAGADMKAAALYRGDLLEGIGLRAEAFEDWLAVERARLQELALASMTRLLQQQAGAGNHDAAVQTALRLIAIDPLQESAHRELMRLYAEQGRLGAALRQFESCRAILRRELGVAPEAATEALFRALSDRRGQACQPPGRAAPGEQQPAGDEAAAEPTEPERKFVTVLSAEIAPHPDASDDPEADLEFLDAATHAVAAAVARYQGTIIARQGQVTTALFGAPTAHEDHAVRACYAALVMQEAVTSLSAARLCLRGGLNVGPVVVRHRDGGEPGYEAVGTAVSLSGRIQQFAPPGAIGLSAETLHQAEGFVEAEAAGQLALGRGQVVEIFLLRRRRPLLRPWQARAARGLSRFVGREPEMAQLGRALADAGAAEGRLVAVVGDPGVGKSRLVYEFAQSHLTADWRVLEAGGSALETASAYGVVSQILRAWCRIGVQDGQSDIAEKVRSTVLALDRALAPALAVLFALLDIPIEDEEWPTLSPAQRRRRTLGCLKAVFARLSQERPLLILLEDLHWTDSETQAVLNTLLDSLSGLRLLLLVTHRPEYRHDWMGRSGFSFIRLDPLPALSAEQLLRHLLGDHPSLQHARRLLIERTGGTPLFLEETVRALAESGVLSGTQGDYRLSGDIDAVEVPGSVQAVLAARVDRLPPNSKALLQAAAIVGVEVPESLLRPIANLSDADYDSAIETLKSAEFLREGRQLPETEYHFKHALTHDVAYNSQLREHRRLLHVRLLRLIEERHRDRLDEQAERLAFHAVSGQMTEAAVTYLYRAALKAIRRSAHGQAIEHLTKGLSLLAPLPETVESLRQELDYQKAMGVTMMAARGWGAQEVSDAYTRAREICEKLQDEQELFTVLRGQGQFHMIRGDLQTARGLGNRCIELAAQSTDAGLQLESHHLLWSNSFFMGDYGNATRHASEGISRYRKDSHHPLTYVYSGHDPGVCCRAFSGLVLWQQGYPEAAVAHCREALVLAEDVGHPLTVALAHWALSYLYLFRQEPEIAAEWAEREIAVCREFLLPLLLSQGQFQLGWALARQGQLAEGVAKMEGGLERIRATGSEMGLPYFVALLGEVYAIAGNVQRGRREIEEAVATAERTGAYFGYSEMLRLKGELLLLDAPQNVEAAEACFQAALDAAHRQGARLPELRAAVRIAGLWSSQGRQEAGRSLVQTLYDGFSEGHETPDLRDAAGFLGRNAVSA